MGRLRAGTSRRSPLRWVTAAALGGATALFVVTPASAAPVDVTAGSLDWGFKASFRNYVATGNGNPPIAVSDGATRNTDGTFRFSFRDGNYDAAAGTATVHYDGTVVFSYPSHFFTITMANPTVVLSGAAGSLRADVDLTVTGGGFEPISVDQAEIATLATGGPQSEGSTVTWSNLATTMTEIGASAFAGFYGAGTALDPATVRITAGGGAAAPTVTVNPATGIDPAGTTATVTGSGFDPQAANGSGIYVAFGPKNDADYWVNSRRYKSVKWVNKNVTTPSGGQDVLNADGTFDTTLDVAARYTDGNGNDVDCTVVQCYILTFAAHGSADRSQDTFTPVSFATPAAGSADQEITAQVRQTGPLTLAVAGSTVALSAVEPGGTATGALNTVTVKDQRGTNAGWNLVGQVEQFTSPLGGTIAPDNLGWVPTASFVNDGLVSTPGVVTPGAAANPGAGTGLGTARTLCSSAAGASGGQFECGAQLNLGVPASSTPGDYTATLTVTLS
ncbi:HtaA domain-containing protein [Polymorphospora sp. NPDC050346]|uniref:HtaA domain-containing protein n=1 Tax=Polymorphospora sp. NPDC050346 TaxID=3155780 RepID=UPI0033E7A0F9